MLLPIEMRKAYLVRRKADLLVLSEACKKQEAQVLERAGHQLRGNAISYGFAPLSDFGSKLETASKEKDFNQAKHWVEEIQKYVESYRFE